MHRLNNPYFNKKLLLTAQLTNFFSVAPASLQRRFEFVKLLKMFSITRSYYTTITICNTKTDLV